jgi:endonuclease/exonuclease/phosphatase family metal-dependent hydrolase
LEQSLASAGGQRYQLVRESSYWAPNTAHGTQGTRILYDTSRYSLRSSCPETTGTSSWNASCTIKLPLRDTDSEEARRIAAYAQFADRKTGQRFYAVTAHLDERHSSNTTTEQSYNVLRGRQSAAIADAMTKINTDGLPVIVGGDFNSWQNNQVGNAGHEAFVTKGYYDTAAALTRVKLAYPTVNQFKLTVEPNSLGVGVRLDAIKVKGIQGATRTENVLLPDDAERPSDHSLVVSDLVL